MKYFIKFMILSGLCVASLANAQTEGYMQYSYPTNNAYNRTGYEYQQDGSAPYFYQANPNNPYGQIPQSYQQGYSQQGQWNSTEYPVRPGQPPSPQNEMKKQEKSSWSSWFGGESHETMVVPDQAITSRVMQNIRSTPYFSPAAKNIRVSTKDGKVTIQGKAANKNEKNQIEYMIKNVPGVKSVDNDIESEK